METEPRMSNLEPAAQLESSAGGRESAEETRVIDGVKCRRVESGYTVRQYFSHFTEGVGPGGGWDRFNAPGGKESIIKELGLDIGPETLWKLEPQDLPDTPYYRWEPIE